MEDLGIAVLVLLGSIFILLIGILIIITLFSLFIIRDTSIITEIHTKSHYILHQLNNLIKFNTAVDVIKDSTDDVGKTIYQSPDGRYTANSLEDLMSMMVQDPESGLTDLERETLKNFFEKFSKDDDINDQEDE